ncbi:MAG: DUF2442 domain-containing protein [Acidobacteriota bacterium]
MDQKEWNWPLVDVVEARHIDRYKIWVRFENGIEGEVDLSDLLDQGVFRPLRDVELFKRFHIEYGTIVWNEQVDIAPESLYRRVLEREPSTPPVNR